MRFSLLESSNVLPCFGESVKHCGIVGGLRIRDGSGVIPMRYYRWDTFVVILFCSSVVRETSPMLYYCNDTCL